jgi:hypothetical protein
MSPSSQARCIAGARSTSYSIKPRRGVSMSNALFPCLYRGCGKSSAEVSFATLWLRRCTACVREQKQERETRILARGSRVTTAQAGCTDVNPKRLAWIRKFPCAVRRSGCSKVMDARHVRSGSAGGTG